MSETERVTLAVIKRDLEYIKDDIKEIKKSIDKSSEVHIDHEKRIGSVETKLGNITLITIGFSAIMSAIATWLGVRK